ncbi:MAG TPA: DinB family protein [Flavobacterium sp.]|uniref:DinB family protein n=1 Tax=Flavobacterium sp. TaxID=239 RepID=UPI002DBA9B11|nr:DinB family protein [Flavobacterium sp.]HEU4789737.1 DinB family protein [Flavobacterium sp.]
MIVNKSKNAVNALLSEYRKVIMELQNVIQNISDEKLVLAITPETNNEDCKSIQTILAHVVNSGYAYCVYIRNLRDATIKRPKKEIRKSVEEYKEDLNNVLLYTYETFDTIYDNDLENFNESKKIKTSWGQIYDIEQLFEHAIVHVLRHRRQIENFKTTLEIYTN